MQDERVPGAGDVWAAWSYRNGAEYDIAVSVLVDGRWSEPTLLEAGSGRDEVEPALSVDKRGNLYLAYSTRREEAVYLTVLPAGASQWSAEVPLSTAGESARPESPSAKPAPGKIFVRRWVCRFSVPVPVCVPDQL